MATLTRSGVSADMSRCMYAPQLTGTAGAAITAGDACYVKASDGKIYPSNGTAANEAATFWGIAPADFSSGAAATIFGIGARLKYGSGLTVGAKLYISATAGKLDDAATTGGTVAVARVLPGGEDIEIIVQAT